MSKNNREVSGDYVTLDGESYYRIANSQLMDDFFMSVVGAGDHWMFVSSSGALTAGRRNADRALFPYAADDQITAARGDTGSTTLIRTGGGLWEPFAAHSAGPDEVRRNLYKTPLGSKLVFEEINETRGLSFRYRWTFSQRFGFVRSCRLENIGADSRSLELLDGLQNLLPCGIDSEFLMRFSNLANAYKKSELVPASNIGLFYLSSIPTDRAEPSEGLKATTVWQSGLSPDAILLSPAQISAFRAGKTLQPETDVRGKRGAFLLKQSVELAPGEALEWQIVAELAQDHAAVIAPGRVAGATPDPALEIAADIVASEQEFLRILSSSDAIQSGANRRLCNRHLSNTVFNVMRGGVPLDGYRVHADDFRRYRGKFQPGHRRAERGVPRQAAGNAEHRRIAICHRRARRPRSDAARIGIPPTGVQPPPWRSDAPMESLFNRSAIRERSHQPQLPGQLARPVPELGGLAASHFLSSQLA